MLLCLTFIDLKKTFDSVEAEAVMEALDSVTRQCETFSPKTFTGTLEYAMRKLEWDDMGVDVWQLHRADDIVLMTTSITESAKDDVHMPGWVSDASSPLNGTNICERTSYVYLGREINMTNDMTFELDGRRRAAWGAYKSIEDVVKKTKNIRLYAHLYNTTVLLDFTYASETWAFRKQEENAVSIIERAIETVMLGVSRFTQAREGIRSPLLRQRSKIRDAAELAKKSKISAQQEDGRPDGQISSRNPSKKIMMRFVSQAKRETTGRLARDRNKWKNYCR
ncbi:hypothetical protein RB195_018487 [Necator americanus]|uniref:Reverse transcriptase domain-containing protein n=1 Tax=Necator americanus TaxID=51031 RepID=A0ABR1CCW7_NECAM